MANYSFTAIGIFKSGYARNADDSSIARISVIGYKASLQQFIGEDLSDTINGTSGNDAIFYDFYSSRDGYRQRIDGIDFINGGDGDDIIDLTSSSLPDYMTFVTISGDNGNDSIWSGSGNDTLRGGTGNDVLWGGAGNDDIRGEAGDDTLYGFDGDDILECDEGTNLLTGGAGDDKFVVPAGAPGSSAVNIIEDFVVGGTEDVIDLRGFSLDFAGVESRLSKGASEVVVLNLNGFSNESLNSGIVEFNGITETSALTSSDFIFSG